ncbi:unnamed protein product, partial [Rotaria socialis]
RQLAVPAAKQLASAQLQKFNLLKEKFDRQQPIDIVFGMKIHSFRNSKEKISNGYV